MVREGLYTTAAGLAVRFKLSSAVSRIFIALLYNVVPTDPVTLAGAAIMIMVLSTFAMAIPACRASMTDPNTVPKQG